MRVMTFLPEGTPADDSLGLAQPAYRIGVQAGEARDFEILVGKRTPTGFGYYAQVDGQTPIVVDQFNIDTVVSLMNELLAAPEGAQAPAGAPATPAP
jgi:hypothetical protein